MREIFKKSEVTIEPARIMKRIKSYEDRRCRLIICTHSILAISALLIFIPASKYFYSGLIDSGFIEYISLFVTDSKYALQAIGDITLSLILSWPLMASILALSAITIIVNSVRKLLTYRHLLANFNHKII